MRFTLMQQPFQNALRAVGGALSPRNMIPALAGIHLEAKGSHVILRATDLEHAIRLELPATVVAEGAVVLPGRHLVELVRRLPPAEIAVSVDPGNSTARILCADSDFTVHGLAPDQFPPDPVPGEERVTIDTGAVRTLLRETGFAVAHDESRPWFTGVHLVIRGEAAEAMATDSAVLAYSRVVVANPFDLAMAVIIPGRSVQELSQLLAGEDAERCDMIPVHNQLLFRFGALTLTTRL
ncbi:MAG: DNA polymerase III subunit beta, partial [Mycobacterium leprae]